MLVFRGNSQTVQTERHSYTHTHTHTPNMSKSYMRFSRVPLSNDSCFVELNLAERNSNVMGEKFTLLVAAAAVRVLYVVVGTRFVVIFQP